MIKLHAAAVLLPLLAGSASATELDLQLFGKEPVTEVQLACFVRHYDDAHLKTHPDQNVTSMALLVGSGDPATGDTSFYSVGIGVNFRGVANEMQLAGGCSADNGGTSLGCGIDCDGGVINVMLRDANSVRVEIPDGARTWDPESDDDPDPAAEFGSDDKVFRLDRVGLEQCLSLLWDDDLKARITSGG